jgi:hypothetical protein
MFEFKCLEIVLTNEIECSIDDSVLLLLLYFMIIMLFKQLLHASLYDFEIFPALEKRHKLQDLEVSGKYIMYVNS